MTQSNILQQDLQFQLRAAQDRFLQKFDCPGEDCWQWKASVNDSGYGMLMLAGIPRRAHRLAWLFFRGDIPAGLLVLHQCDNPACCNPDHLYLGTYRDNMLDCIRRGRYRNGKELQTHCIRGHPLSGDNLEFRKGHRRCRRCNYLRHAQWRKTKRGRELTNYWNRMALKRKKGLPK